MAVMSSINFWAIPLLILVAAIAIWGGFRARAMLVVLALTVLISDSGVGNGLKHLIRRPRPNEVLAGVRIVSLNLHHPLPRLIAMFTTPHKEIGAEKAGETGWIRIALSRSGPGPRGGAVVPVGSYAE